MYTNLQDRLKFLNTKIEIVDDKELNTYMEMLNNSQQLPEGISYVNTYDVTGNAKRVFYREATNEEIKEMIEISNAKSLKRTGDALHFFKILTIVGLVGSALIYLIALLLTVM